MSNIAINAKASFFVFIGRFSERLIGLVSTLILARLLMPEDFGIVALVWLVLRFLDAMATTGSEEYIIQKDVLSRQDLNTAWTINLMFKGLLVLAVVMVAPFVADFYEEERLRLALPVLALVMVLAALANPYNFQLKREREYSKLFRIDIWSKIVSATTTISLAFLLRSYWALIFGHLASTFVKFLLSYIYFTYRPSLTLENFKEQLGFSQWMFLRGIFGHVRATLDTFLVSYRFSADILGGYHVSRYLAMMPGVDGVGPAMAPLFASFSSVQNDKKELGYQVGFALLALMSLTIPMAAFMCINAAEITLIVLGTQWVDFSSVFGVLSLAVITRPLHNFCVAILLVSKKTKLAFYYDVLTLFGMAAVLLLAPINSIFQFALYKTGFDIFCVTCFLLYVLNLVGISKLVRVFALIGVTSAYVALVGSGVSFIMEAISNVYIRVLIEGIICLICWLVYCQVFYHMILKSTTIGFHIEYLEKKYMRGMKFFSFFG